MPTLLYLYIYIYMYIHMQIYIYTHIYICIHTCIYCCGDSDGKHLRPFDSCRKMPKAAARARCCWGSARYKNYVLLCSATLYGTMQVVCCHLKYINYCMQYQISYTVLWLTMFYIELHYIMLYYAALPSESDKCASWLYFVPVVT